IETNSVPACHWLDTCDLSDNCETDRPLLIDQDQPPPPRQQATQKTVLVFREIRGSRTNNSCVECARGHDAEHGMESDT
ncbi:MAG: hypothetical protein ACK5HA_00145, partial [Planctomycetaceae bacterium]